MTAPSHTAQIDLFVDSLKEIHRGLVVCLSNSWGGLEQVAAQDSVAIGSLGLSTRVICLEGSPIHENLAHRKELTLVPLGFRPRNYFDLKMRGELLKLLEEGVNLIHTHQTSLLGSIVPWLWKKPHVAMLATRHIMNNHSKKNFLYRAIYRRLDALIVMSQALKKNVLETHAIHEKQLRVVNLGLDFTVFDPKLVDATAQRKKWGVTDDVDKPTLVIGLVGRIDPAKGQGIFLKAAAGILKNKETLPNLKFVVVGEETLGTTGAYLDELKEMVVQFHIEENVIFAGYHENIPEVMSAFDIFVMPSRQETFGLVAIEAMAMERPIVISRGGSSDEIVGNDENGLKVRSEDAFDLQHKLRLLIDNPELRKEKGRKARIYVQNHYDKNIRLIKTLEIYERSLRRRGNY